MQESGEADEGPRLVTTRTMDIAVSLLFLVVSGIVILDCFRLGFGWIPNEGPASGYVPFYIAVIMAGASLVNLFSALRIGHSAHEMFVSKPAFMRVLAVLLPAFGYVALIGFVGIYVASALFILGFMLTLGKEKIIRAVLVATGVPVFLFVLFEIWFLVPLPKGPLEAMLGY